jgi:hypothetical protein
MAAKVALWLFIVILGVSFLMEAPTPIAIAP